MLLRHRRTGHTVVSKQVPVDGMAPQELAKVENEVRILSALSHAHIIAYHCSFQHDDKLHIVMEYAARGSLEGAISARREDNSAFALLTLLGWLQQLGGALQHMHAKHILHRDLKAANVFLADDGSADGAIKLGDFGISRALSSQTNLAETVCGTPFYLSPELIRSAPYREGSDVWALGVLLYELLTLKRPFDGPNIAVLALNISRGAYDEAALADSPYPHWVQRLASREALLHADPARRLTLPQLLAAICGNTDGADDEALLGLLAAKASGPSLLRVQKSLSRINQGGSLSLLDEATQGRLEEESQRGAEQEQSRAQESVPALAPAPAPVYTG